VQVMEVLSYPQAYAGQLRPEYAATSNFHTILWITSGFIPRG